MTPLNYYNQLIAKRKILANASQQRAIIALNRIFLNLKRREHGLLKLINHIYPSPTKGLYLWGSVGVGKTFLMDIFFDCLPSTNKLRLHFHEFMQLIHNELTQRQGQKNPLQRIAISLAQKYKVICFDEFFVVNIADAVILGELFTALFKQGICLITSSNVKPDELYQHGIQRELFLPAIKILKKHTYVLQLSASNDYRRSHIEQAGTYYTPLDHSAKHNMLHAFKLFSQREQIIQEPINLFDRSIDVVQRTKNLVWFEFKALCNVPRSQNDFIEIAKRYETVLISDIPILKASQRALVTNFIHLIDILYDHKTRVIISAAGHPHELYPKGPLSFEYRRTCSRLIEMQSADYFGCL